MSDDINNIYNGLGSNPRDLSDSFKKLEDVIRQDMLFHGYGGYSQYHSPERSRPKEKEEDVSMCSYCSNPLDECDCLE